MATPQVISGFRTHICVLNDEVKKNVPAILELFEWLIYLYPHLIMLTADEDTFYSYELDISAFLTQFVPT